MGEDGKPLFDAVPTTDWGDPETLEHWREAWAAMVNAKFEEKGLPCCLRSMRAWPSARWRPRVSPLTKKRRSKKDLPPLLQAALTQRAGMSQS